MPNERISMPPGAKTMPNERLPIFRKELTDSWRSLLGWTLGIAAAILLYLPFYPSVGGGDMVQTYLDAFSPEVAAVFGLDEMSTGAGYTQASYFGLTAFLLLSIAAIAWGATAIAGDEESGSLELLLAHGVTRAQVLGERVLTIVVRLVWLGLVGMLLILALNGSAQLQLQAGNLLAVSAALTGLVLLVGMAALFAGAVSGRRSLAIAVGAGLAVLAYVLDAVAGFADLPWLANVSPYHWAFGASPLSSGADWGGLAALYAVSVLLLLASWVAFDRRDVRA